ncbi:MAG: hypothetical protein KAR42_04690 [candidate division Zixibacteria bacterium]|nr:hypothetical protein [candidate division Zixibacteria bacterium]
MLLIATNKEDLTSDYLILRLEEQKIPFYRINTEDYLEKYDIDIKVNNGNDYAIIYDSNGREVNSDTIRGVYIRQPVMPKTNAKINSSHASFAIRESIETLRSLWRIIDESLWLNHPKYLLAANNKIEQLSIASELGFLIPPTLVSTREATILNFIKTNYNDVIAKSVKHGFYVKEDKVQIAFTKKVNSDFCQNIETYSKIPMIYQRRIDKLYDIRVTIVGKHIYSAAIHSQQYKESEIDWRAGDVEKGIELDYSVIQLPQNIENLCFSITRKFGLNYSAIDLIYTPDLKYYFLEMNSNGQWAWLEEKLRFPIRDSIIDYYGELS